MRAVVQARSEPEPLDEAVDAGALDRARAPAVELERQQDVAERIQGRHEIEGLKDEPDATAAQDRQLEVAETRDVGVADPGAALAGARRAPP